MLTKVSHIFSISAVYGDAQRAPRRYFGKVIVKYSAQNSAGMYCGQDSRVGSEASHSASVLLFRGIWVLIMDRFRYRMDSDILRARRCVVGQSVCPVQLVWMRRGGTGCCASDGEERKERCKLTWSVFKRVTRACWGCWF